MESLKELMNYSDWLDAEAPESEEEIMELEEEKMIVRQEIEAANERGDWNAKMQSCEFKKRKV